MNGAHPVVSRYARHVNPTLVKLLGVLGYGRLFVRAKDVWVWDHEGRRYLDFLAGFGSVNVGHNHPRLLKRLKEILEADPVHFLHVGPSGWAADLAERLAGLTGLDLTLFSTSGAEAVEAAMKLARAATGRSGFVSCEGGFHGTSLGTLSILGEKRMRAPFEPLLGGSLRVPFGDRDALRRALSGRGVAAFILEPLQAEGGVVLPPAGYLEEAQEICRRFGTLLVLDEVQTGLGRTGCFLASGAEGVVPDVLVLAKSLGGGIAPIAATLTRREIHRKAYGSTRRFDLHGSTFSGSALSCAAALETLDVLEEESLVAESARRGAELLSSFRRRLAGHPLVRDVRGRGLLVGIELGAPPSAWMKNFARSVFGQWVALRLLEKGILVQPAALQWNVLRFEPPLTVKAPQIATVVSAVGEILDEYRGLAPLVRDVSSRVKTQFRRGWVFS